MRDTVVAVRLDPGSVAVLDMLVESGVAKSRSEATARLVQIGISASGSLLESVREACLRARSLREAFGVPKGASDEAGAAIHAETRGEAPAAQTETSKEERDPGESPDDVLLRYREAFRTGRREIPEKVRELLDAATTRDRERFESLLAEDPELLSRYDENGWTPLHVAALSNDYLPALYLLSSEANPSAKSANALGTTPLHAAAFVHNDSTAEMLIRYEADVNVQDAHGWTPLHLAAYMGDPKVAMMLLRSGADLSLKTHRGETAFDFAMMSGRDDIARWIADAQTRRNRLRRR